MRHQLVRCGMKPGRVTGVGRVYHPYVAVRFQATGSVVWSPKYYALVDSGASVTIAREAIARKCQINLQKASTRIQLSGVGGGGISGPLITLRMKIGPHMSGVPLFLEEMKVLFTNDSIPAQVLLGQHNLLERLQFIQRNQRPNPELVLRIA